MLPFVPRHGAFDLQYAQGSRPGALSEEQKQAIRSYLDCTSSYRIQSLLQHLRDNNFGTPASKAVVNYVKNYKKRVLKDPADFCAVHSEHHCITNAMCIFQRPDSPLRPHQQLQHLCQHHGCTSTSRRNSRHNNNGRHNNNNNSSNNNNNKKATSHDLRDWGFPGGGHG